MAFQRWWGPLLVLLVQVPFVVESIVLQVYCFVDGGKCAWREGVSGKQDSRA